MVSARVPSDSARALHNTTVFRGFLNSCFPGMLLCYCLNDFEMVPVAPVLTGITFAFKFHMG